MNKIIFISFKNKLWQIHTDKETIGHSYLLKSVALGVAINHVLSFPEGEYIEIRVQSLKKGYFIYWTLAQDGFPPKIRPLRSVNIDDNLI